MIVGTGISMVKIERIETIIKKYSEHFVERVFTKQEIDYCLGKSKLEQHFAGKFAAKEVPHGFDHSQIPNILQRKKLWIENARRRIKQQRSIIKPETSKSLPERICLQAINEEFFVEYKLLVTHWVEATENDNDTILISGAINKHILCKTVLQKWVNYKAKKHLIPWLKMMVS